jgi:hypothetical protein
MTIVVLVGAEKLVKFTSSHEFFSSNSHLGYSTLTTETLSNLSFDVFRSMKEAPPVPLVYLYVPGNA